MPWRRRAAQPDAYNKDAGGMGEWLIPAVLKTVNGETRSGVRIPLPPPRIKSTCFGFPRATYWSHDDRCTRDSPARTAAVAMSGWYRGGLKNVYTSSGTTPHRTHWLATRGGIGRQRRHPLLRESGARCRH